MAVRIVTPIQKRFSDVDSFLHVNNVAQQMYFDVGKSDFFHRLLSLGNVDEGRRIITVSTRTDYRGQIRLEDEIVVTTEAEQIGTTSIRLLQRLVCRCADGREEIRTESRSVMVAFDFVRQEKFRVPDTWRRAMLDNGGDRA